MLCVSYPSGDDPKAEKRRAHIEYQAKCFFLRHYVAQKQKLREGENATLVSLLQEKVSIPQSWFDKALALSCAYNGDIVGYVNHLVASEQVEPALRATKLIILPESLIMGEESSKKLKNYLEMLKRGGLDNGELPFPVCVCIASQLLADNFFGGFLLIICILQKYVGMYQMDAERL